MLFNAKTPFLALLCEIFLGSKLRTFCMPQFCNFFRQNKIPQFFLKKTPKFNKILCFHSMHLDVLWSSSSFSLCLLRNAFAKRPSVTRNAFFWRDWMSPLKPLCCTSSPSTSSVSAFLNTPHFCLGNNWFRTLVTKSRQCHDGRIYTNRHMQKF